MKLSLRKIATTIAITTALVISGVGLFNVPAYAATDNPKSEVCAGVNAALKDGCNDQNTNTSTVWGWAKTVVNWLLIIAGIVAVGFIIFAGIRYVTSGGDAEKVKKAKSTLLYAIIGLIIAALALVIVNLVLGVVFKVV